MYLYLSLIAGILHCTGFAPFNLFFASVLSISLLYYIIINSKSVTQAQKYTLIFGFTYYVSSLHWIVNSLFVELESFWYLVPLALIVIPFFLSLYFLPIAIFIFYAKKLKFFRSFVFATLWALCELARSYFFTGFPWNLFASVIIDDNWGISAVRICGPYLAGFLIILLICSFYEFCYAIFTKRFITSNTLIFACIIFLFTGIIISDDFQIEQKKFSIKIVQPNINQKLKWKTEELQEILNKTISLSFPSDEKYIVWPETAFPFAIDIEKQNPYIKYVSQFLHNDQYLITGIIRKENNNYYNSTIIINNQGKILDFYDKKHLVPFGEFIPFRKFLNFSVTRNFADLSKGNKDKLTIAATKTEKFQPLICYEALFPYQNTDADAIIAVTNDGWFGKSFGPYQHLRSARILAITAKKPVIRVANTGISAYIDTNGKVLQELKLFVSNVFYIH